jgi:hypothetical protein
MVWLWPTATPEKKEMRPKIVVPFSSVPKTFGPEWEKIELTQGVWTTPRKLKNGSGWRVAQGKIWVSKDGGTPYQDGPSIQRYGGGKEVSFSAVSPTAIVFFKY